MSSQCLLAPRFSGRTALPGARYCHGQFVSFARFTRLMTAKRKSRAMSDDPERWRLPPSNSTLFHLEDRHRALAIIFSALELPRRDAQASLSPARGRTNRNSINEGLSLIAALLDRTRKSKVRARRPRCRARISESLRIATPRTACLPRPPLSVPVSAFALLPCATRVPFHAAVCRTAAFRDSA